MDFYVEFIYEKKYNLSNQTVLTWMIERLKGILVSAIIGLPLLVAFVALLGKFPQTWWVIAGTLFFSFSVLLSNLAPVLIFPIFYRFKPLENLALSEKLKSLARGEGLRIKDVFSFNLSKNTKKANAALAGLGNTRRIIISDTLLENLDDDEIIAVFAHELGHHRLHHMARQIGLGAVNIFAGFFIVSRLLQILLSFFSDKFSGATDPAAFPLIILLLSLFGVGLRPVNATISRKYEKAADRYGVKLLGTSKHLVSSLRKLAKQNMADPDPHVLVEWYAYSHPPLNKRIGIWHPCSQMKDYESFPPVKITRGRGVFLFDAAGNRLIDGISSWWVNTLGHCNPRLNRALINQLKKLEHVIFTGFTHDPAIDLSESLIKIAPRGLKKIFFADNGSSAVEVALKMSFQYARQTGKRRAEFIALTGAYHGETLGALSVSGMDLYRRMYAPMLMKACFARAPSCIRCPFEKKPHTCRADCFQFLESAVERVGPANLAGIIHHRAPGPVRQWDEHVSARVPEKAQAALHPGKDPFYCRRDSRGIRKNRKNVCLRPCKSES
jgi:Zn-dependent protease with chaperone function